jgi:putative transport protein
MRVKIFTLITNYYFLSFFTLCLGMLFGEWKKMGKLRFGISGPLFVGIVTGWVVISAALAIPEDDLAYGIAQNLIKTNIVPGNLQAFMLTLFIGAVGLIASRDLLYVLKMYGAKFVLLGVLITSFGATLSYVGSVWLIPGGNAFKASGLYTGSLTSSPGLGAALESSAGYVALKAARYSELGREEQSEMLLEIDPSGVLTPENTSEITDEQADSLSSTASSDVGMAYAVAYPFGLISVILGMMFIPRLFRINCAGQLLKHRAALDEARKKSAPPRGEQVEFEFKSFALVCAVGYIIGHLEVKIGDVGAFSFGASGGVFLASVTFGCLGKLGPFNFRMSGSAINSFKDISLGTYLGMVGLAYGYRVVLSLTDSGIMYAIAAFLIGSSCVMLGFLFGHYVLKLNWVILSGAICGGMTSNPALGVASNVIGSDDPAAGYAAVFPFAISGMIMFTILMYAV